MRGKHVSGDACAASTGDQIISTGKSKTAGNGQHGRQRLEENAIKRPDQCDADELKQENGNKPPRPATRCAFHRYPRHAKRENRNEEILPVIRDQRRDVAVAHDEIGDDELGTKQNPVGLQRAQNARDNYPDDNADDDRSFHARRIKPASFRRPWRGNRNSQRAHSGICPAHRWQPDPGRNSLSRCFFPQG